MDSAWPQLFNDISNLTLWYFLLLTLDFAWKFSLSNFLQFCNLYDPIFSMKYYICLYLLLHYFKFYFLGRIICPLIIFYIYIYIFLKDINFKFLLCTYFLKLSYEYFLLFYFTWLLVFCMCSSTLVVANRDGNHSLRNLCKMAALQVF